jgi:hypothetical protein
MPKNKQQKHKNQLLLDVTGENIDIIKQINNNERNMILLIPKKEIIIIMEYSRQLIYDQFINDFGREDVYFNGKKQTNIRSFMCKLMSRIDRNGFFELLTISQQLLFGHMLVMLQQNMTIPKVGGNNIIGEQCNSDNKVTIHIFTECIGRGKESMNYTVKKTLQLFNIHNQEIKQLNLINFTIKSNLFSDKYYCFVDILD